MTRTNIMQITAVERLRILPLLCALVCSFLCVATAQNPTKTDSDRSRLPAVRLDGNYFSRDGHRFIPVGANWVPAVKAMQWPTEWDPKAIEADFARMHAVIFPTSGM